jgi:hypothetical protein
MRRSLPADKKEKKAVPVNRREKKIKLYEERNK